MTEVANMVQTDSIRNPSFGLEEIKYLLKSKADCLHAGLPANDMIIETLDEIRNHYIHEVGLANYLSQMLGELGQVPARDCTLYLEDGTRITKLIPSNQHQPIQHFIVDAFRRDRLPFRIEVYREASLSQAEVCYL
jgi:hypothetical protein